MAFKFILLIINFNIYCFVTSMFVTSVAKIMKNTQLYLSYGP